MIPQSKLASTGYCLADPGRKYLAYKSEEGYNKFTLTLTPGKYSVEWINLSSGKSLKSQDLHAKTGKNIFVPPLSGPAILYLQKMQN